MQNIQEIAEMPPIEKQCERHENMVRELTETRMEVRGMKDAHERVAESVDRVSEKLTTIEKNLIWWGGLLGTGGAVMVAAISNLDKIKALFT
jgi:hypothetical protein